MIVVHSQLRLARESSEEGGGGGGGGKRRGSDNEGSVIVTPGELVTATASNFLAGHGTRVDGEGRLVSTISGVVERINKLLSVVPARRRYAGEVGDVVVGKVVDVQMKRWIVDVGGRQDAVLMLTSANLPHGVQRRRTQEDQLRMRSLYAEGDIISAEVHSFFQDGVMSIHARNLKYGKLENGQLVRVSASLMRRLKQHFVTLPSLGVELILGMNGRVWITQDYSFTADASKDAEELQRSREEKALRKIGADARRNIGLVRNALLVLDAAYLPIFPGSILAVVEEAQRQGLACASVLDPKNMKSLTSRIF